MGLVRMLFWVATFATTVGVIIAVIVDKARDDIKLNESWKFVAVIGGSLIIVIGGLWGINTFKNNKEMKLLDSEKTQIEYQIENMTENTDKIKLNEWILTYNDNVNKIKADQELYGWFSMYYGIDMSGYTMIEIV